MRAVVMLLVGMAIGALGAVTAVGAMKQQVHYTKATMVMIRHHFTPLREMVKTGKCDAGDIQRHLRGLEALSLELGPFLPTGGDDQAFIKHGDRFKAATSHAVETLPTTCDALATANQSIGGACKACHDEFR